ncbi:hypothetical protein B0H14DRAFT_2363265, partial [Mycena olivaceomarginata]
LVDIVSPPTGKLTLFNLYVALSRSSGQQTIYDRLEDLNKQTMRWWREMHSSTEMDLSIATQEYTEM